MGISNLEMHEKIKSIRAAEELGSSKFSQRTEIPKRTLEAIENRGTDPRSSFIEGVCKAFPEYSLWIMTNEINLNAGQISPDVKIIWKKEQVRFNPLTIKTNDENEIIEVDENTYQTTDSVPEEIIPFNRFNKEHINLVKNMAKEFKDLITDAIDITNKLEEEYIKAFQESQIIGNTEQTFKFYSPEEIALFDPFDKADKPFDLKGLFKEVIKSTKAKDLTYGKLLKLIKKRTEG